MLKSALKPNIKIIVVIVVKVIQNNRVKKAQAAGYADP